MKRDPILLRTVFTERKAFFRPSLKMLSPCAEKGDQKKQNRKCQKKAKIRPKLELRPYEKRP